MTALPVGKVFQEEEGYIKNFEMKTHYKRLDF